MKTKLKNEKGFTIIEVLIVLAIAGLILLIIFLAVPALQRNSRNTQRRNDVAAILGGVSTYANNNNGRLPNFCAGTDTVTFSDSILANEVTNQANVGYYNRAACDTAAPGAAGEIQLAAAQTLTAAGTLNTGDEDWLRISPQSTCAAGGASVDGGARSFTAVFEIETGTGAADWAQICQAS